MFKFLLFIVAFMALIIFFRWLMEEKDKRKGNKEVRAIRKLAKEGEIESAFNLAQKTINDTKTNEVRAKCFYWQAFCLHQRGDESGTKEKLRFAFQVDPMFDRLERDDDFRKIYSEERKAYFNPQPQEVQEPVQGQD